MKKSLFIIILVAGILFTAGTLRSVFAENFQEPSPDIDLPFPISTSSDPQVIEGSFGVGFSSIADVPLPADAAFYVKGITRTVDYNRTADVTAAGGLLTLKGGSTDMVKILGTGVAEGTCTLGKVCVKPDAAHGLPAVSVIHEDGTGLYGETNDGTEGIYGAGYFGVATYTTNDAAIPLAGQSCTESQGSCFSPYGTAGYFEGDILIDNGILIGTGSKIYQIKSVYNLSEDHTVRPEDPPLAEGDRDDVHEASTNGIAYNSFKLDATTSPQSVSVAGNIFGIFAVESTDSGATWKPAGSEVLITTNGANQISYSSATARKLNLVVTYQLP